MQTCTFALTNFQYVVSWDKFKNKNLSFLGIEMEEMVKSRLKVKFPVPTFCQSIKLKINYDGGFAFLVYSCPPSPTTRLGLKMMITMCFLDSLVTWMAFTEKGYGKRISHVAKRT